MTLIISWATTARPSSKTICTGWFPAATFRGASSRIGDCEMKIAGRILFVGLVGVFGWLVFGRLFVSDEARVRRTIAAMQKAFETGDTLKLSDAIAQSYTDEWGMDKSTLLAAS